METVVINQIKDQSYTMKESLRALKTSISFSGKGVKSILFTSSVPNEGKTTVVMDLARSMADSKKSVLVVDTDMRKSVLVGRLRRQDIWPLALSFRSGVFGQGNICDKHQRRVYPLCRT
jgi:Mrp family chromosome partitioning ATPase